MPKFDWENLVGVKLFSWIAGVALLLAAVFFLRYSISQGWLMPPVRMTIGIVVGVGLLILCELKAARKYPVTANAMDASAIAILFSTFFAARVLWDLIIPVAAFGLMVLVTAVAVLLSIRRDSIFIALLGLVGGFATPALLSTGENRPISLFTYILLLNAGLAWVAIKKKWPLLTMLSFVFTVFYQWGWVMKFLTAAQLPIALGIFLIFPVLAFAAFTLGQRDETREELDIAVRANGKSERAAPAALRFVHGGCPRIRTQLRASFRISLSAGCGTLRHRHCARTGNAAPCRRPVHHSDLGYLAEFLL